MNYAVPRGTKDAMPDDTPVWQWIESRFREIAELYQYREIRTPTFEMTPLFARTSGEASDIVTKEMYTFVDRGDESLTLRPEGTASVVRAYLEHGVGATVPLAKYYYIAPVFRYERPQAGRLREHHQSGIEAIGSQDPALDAEVIALGRQYLGALGITRGEVCINSVGCPICRPAYREKLIDFLTPLSPELCEECQRRLTINPLRVLDAKEERCRELTADAPVLLDSLCEECSGHFERVQEHLVDLNVPYSVDPRLVRGLDYYTKTAFEVRHEGLGAQNQILGGGRYDGFVEQLGGPPTPGVGFGSGIERLILAMEADGAARASGPPPPHVFIVTLGESARRSGVALLGRLRSAGIAAEIGYGARSMKAQMKHADRSRAPLAILLGDDEIAAGVASVRRMAGSEQFTIPLDEVATRLRELVA